ADQRLAELVQARPAEVEPACIHEQHRTRAGLLGTFDAAEHRDQPALVLDVGEPQPLDVHAAGPVHAPAACGVQARMNAVAIQPVRHAGANTTAHAHEIPGGFEAHRAAD